MLAHQSEHRFGCLSVCTTNVDCIWRLVRDLLYGDIYSDLLVISHIAHLQFIHRHYILWPPVHLSVWLVRERFGCDVWPDDCVNLV
jgi:hypothetical protein